MTKKIPLDQFEQEIEDNLDSLVKVDNFQHKAALLQKTASIHLSRKKPITLRVSEMDIEAIKLKASKLGVPYQANTNSLSI